MKGIDRPTGRPAADVDDPWMIAYEVTDARRRAIETVMSVGGPVWAVRDLSIVDEPDSLAATFVAGCSDEHENLVSLPPWTARAVDGEPLREIVRLDLWDGVLTRELRRADGVAVTESRFVSADEPQLGVQHVTALETSTTHTDGSEASHDPPRPASSNRVIRSPVDTCDAAVVVSEFPFRAPETAVADGTVRLAAIGRGSDDSERVAGHVVAVARSRGPLELVRRHRNEWRRRWERAGTSIAGDRELERWVRFATFRLLELDLPEVAPGDARTTHPAVDRAVDLAFGARGLTGTAYRGHVFWDTDVFVLPALSSLAPRAARRMLDYRWARLGPAIDRARHDGCVGARFPWESARSGEEVTPRSAVGLDGRRIDILTGDLELHITADIAWAVWNHVNWSGDLDHLATRGVHLLVESARYWESRLEIDDDGSAHVRDVIGPDEYHVHVDDNAYTNLMVRHDLQIAARVAERFDVVDRTETDRWRELAERVVDGFDTASHRYEQFTGYFDLDDVLASGIAPPPMSADALVGTDVIQRLQVIKQPDVMMAYHLIPHLMRADAFDANLDHYHPRTAHGSSLSPPIAASGLLRAGRDDEGLRWLRLAATLDGHDVTGTTAGGLHLATIGGLWQAVTMGLLGVRAGERDLSFDPRVPPELGRVVHRFGYRGRPVTATVDGEDGLLESDRPISVTVGDATRSACSHRIRHTGDLWEWR